MSAPARSSVHVRDGFSLERSLRCIVIALIPCIFMAFYNTGFQANVDITVAELKSAPGWRGAVLDGLGIGYDTSGIFAAIVHGALYFIPVFAVAMAVGVFWERLFARIRKRPAGEGMLVIALLFALSLPPSIPLWQVAIGITFAVVVGREMFGGTGKYFLNPVLVGLAFLYVTYPKEMAVETAWTVVDAFTTATYLQLAEQAGPETLTWLGTTWLKAFFGFVPGTFGATSTLGCLIGGAYLLYTRVISARVVFGILIGMIATVLLVNQLGSGANTFAGVPWYWHMTLGSFAFGTVFLATDPTSAAMTNRGRWIYGLLIGVMVVIIRVGNTSHPDGVMFAILFGNMFAPLIDYLVMWANIRRRALRNA